MTNLRFAKYIFLGCLISICHVLVGQNLRIDSLKVVLDGAKSDSSLIVLHNQIAYEYIDIDTKVALDYAQKALNHALELQDSNLLAYSYNMVGSVYRYEGNLKEGLSHFIQGTGVAKLIRDTVQMSNGYNNLGLIYWNQGDYEKAIENFQSSLELEQAQNSIRGVSRSFSNLGLIYNYMGEYEKSLEYHHKCLKMRQELKDSNAIANSYMNIGYLNSQQEEHSEAINYFRKCLEIHQHFENERGICAALNMLGKEYYYIKSYSEASSYMESSLEMSVKINRANLIEDNMYHLAKNYNESGLNGQAFDMLHKTMLFKDSMQTENNMRDIAEMETKYETAKKEEQLKIQSLEINHQKTAKKYFVFALIGVLVILLIIMVGFIQKRKANILLREQKLLVLEANEELNQTNEEILAQRDQIEIQKDQLAATNDHIMASITYAKRIQEAILPSDELMISNLPNHFVLYKPKDIVSGDFYWMEAVNDLVLWAAVDCTGHGVPGAFMSILGANGLKKIVNERMIYKPSEILTHLTKHVLNSIKETKKGEVVKDGMDMSLCCWNKTTNTLEFAGANNPLYLIRNKELLITKGTKRPVGHYIKKKLVDFENHEIQLQEGDLIYLFTDGYADQFGGPEGSKFTYKRFRELLLSVHQKSMEGQLSMLSQQFSHWQGNQEQLDDVCVIGVRI